MGKNKLNEFCESGVSYCSEVDQKLAAHVLVYRCLKIIETLQEAFFPVTALPRLSEMLLLLKLSVIVVCNPFFANSKQMERCRETSGACKLQRKIYDSHVLLTSTIAANCGRNNGKGKNQSSSSTTFGDSLHPIMRSTIVPSVITSRKSCQPSGSRSTSIISFPFKFRSPLS